MATINSIDQVITLSSDVIGWLFTWSWQAVLLLGVAWGALKLGRSRSASTRYRVWLIALMAVAALPLLSLIVHSMSLPSAITPALFPAVDTGNALAVGGPREDATPTFSLSSLLWPVLSASWAVGVIVSIIRLGNSLRDLHKIRSAAQPASMSDLGCSFSDLSASDVASVSISLSKDIQSPALAGLFRPVILLPADILSWTSPEERIAILRHELSHVRRHDPLVSLFQSALKALLFFHPMLGYACGQLSLEREIACDDDVLDLGTEPNAYAEAILKAAERTFLSAAVHHAASFASRRTLARRIDMILDPNRMRVRRRQWQVLLLPVTLIATITWMVIPAASREPASQGEDYQSTPAQAISVQSASRTVSETQTDPVVGKETIWVDSVKRGNMLLQARGLGVLLPADDGRLKARLEIAELRAKNIEVGRPASIDTSKGIVSGKVIAINPRALNGMVAVDVSLEGNTPDGVKAGLRVDGIIEVGRLDDVLYIGRPVHREEESTSSLFKLEDDGKTATRVQVRFGKGSVRTMEIVEGLKAGDKVIISDMSQYEGVVTIKLN